jgi:ABC-type transport system involved in multi-copper enzyme maturation permease subunit
MVRQTLAILHDAYRELNSKRMFWITLIISAVTIGGWAIISIGPNGLMLAGTDWETPYIPPMSEYKFLFTTIVIDWWLTWGVLILALISTAGIFPDFLSGGSVDLYIAKPISRARLFVTKYFCGMLFAFLQVAIFSVVAFFVVGIRAHLWEPRLFLAIPIALCLFSYLYTIAVLLGVLTRSTVATLLLTILLWGVVGGVHFSEVRMLAMKNVFERRIERLDQQIANLDHARPTTNQAAAGALHSAASMLGLHLPRVVSPERDRLVARRDNTASWVRIFGTMHRLTYPVHLILPKTSETSDLLDHALLTSDEFLDLLSGRKQEMQENFRRQVRDPDVFDIPGEIDTIRRSRSTQSILLSSLAFEAVILGLSAWIFCRRDF